MNFFADESIDFPVINILRKHGFDIRSVSEEFPGEDDDFVLTTANNDTRILITDVTQSWKSLRSDSHQNVP